ncbi:DUF983 domain-containing protein [Lichenibacterium minor]|uniref:DUF983 domain-containing protein n=1 Tax=Lichenibacterium minor TaxID=2316528 RepID=A0A4Q2U8K1_9HYPH|nr:DUF983 domain-containing protein [Lichenibacterium minor]RYC32820.1 DUF983 domain-containing protein [Lichenibacterium minor]
METAATPNGHGTALEDDRRRLWSAMGRGALHRCPACGRGALFRAYLKPAEACAACGEALFHQRADDAPPYVTIFVVGHLIVAAAVGVDLAYAWPLWLHAAVWAPLTVALSLGLLPVAKGALIGLQWALRMHGFGHGPEEAEVRPAVARVGAAAEARPTARHPF